MRAISSSLILLSISSISVGIAHKDMQHVFNELQHVFNELQHVFNELHVLVCDSDAVVFHSQERVPRGLHLVMDEHWYAAAAHEGREVLKSSIADS
jgi:hypothetical protein